MGKLITFWSPYHGQCRTTATAVAVAGTATGNSIITHTQTRMSNMENMFGFSEQNKKGYLNDTGLNSLIYSITSRELTKEDVTSAALQITENLSLLPSLGQNSNDADKDAITLHLLTSVLPKYYDYVFVDLGTETRELAKKIQEKADINFVVFSQNKMIWNKYDNIPHARYILADYDKDSKHTAKHFKFNVANDVCVIPHCTEFMDAIASGTVRNFLLRNEKIITNKKSVGVNEFFRRAREVKL